MQQAVQKGWHIRIGSFRMTVSVKTVLFLCFMTSFALFMMLPLIYVVSTAFKPLDELFTFPPRILVQKPTLANFQDLITALSGTSVPFLRNVYNSTVVTSVIVLISIIISCMGAYSLAKIKVPGSRFISTLIIASLMFPIYVTQIPSYLIVNQLHLVDTLWALIIPKLAAPLSLFLIQQFCVQLPDPILEAARIDGANQWKTFWKIVMPFLSPAWATLLVFSFVGNWNDYFSPLIYITDAAKKTLPIALASISGEGMARVGASAATTLLMTMPTILIFTIAQRKVIQTMVHSGIKT